MDNKEKTTRKGTFLMEEMLRKFMQTALQKARTPARFFPLTALMIGLFLSPIILQNYHAAPALAEAGFFDGMGTAIVNGLGEILAGIAWVIFKVVGLVFALSAYLFDYAIDFSTRGSTYSGMKFINIGWTFARDLVNSTFIFAVLAIAFKQLLSFSDIDTSGTQKALKNLVIAALLINFSLFFTKVAIDISNMVARGLYYKVSTTTAGSTTGTGAGQILYGPAHALADGLNLQSALDQNGVKLAPLNRVIIYLGGAAFMMVTTLIFFASAFMFIVRIGILMIIMLTSPLYFLSYTLNFPAIQGIKKQWTDALKSQVLFPIIFLLITYVTVVFVRTSDMFGVKGSGASLAKAFTAESGSFSIIINYVIITLLMVFALKYSRSVGASATSLGGTLQKGFLGAQGMVGRQVIGRFGKMAANSQTIGKMTSSKSATMRFAGDKLKRGSQYAAESSFDVRSNKLVQMSAGYAGTQLGSASTKTFAKDGGKVSRWAGNQLATAGPQGEGRLARAVRWAPNAVGSGLQKFAGDVGGEEGRKAAQKAFDKSSNEAIAARYASDPSSLAAQLKGKFGDKAFEGKGGEANRKAVVDSIEKKFKDSPSQKASAFKAAFGDAYETSSDYKGIRAKLEKETKAEQAKTTLADKSELAAATSYSKSDHEKAVAEANKPENRTNTAAKEKVKQLDLKQAAHNRVVEAAKSAKTEDIVELDVATLEMLANNNALTKKSLAAIEAKLQEESAYLSEDKERINKMARNMLMNGPEETRGYLKAQATKGTSGFDLDMTPVIEEARLSNNDSDLRKALGNMSPQSVLSLDSKTLFDPKVLWQAPPNALAAYAKKAEDTGDSEMMNNIKQGITALKDGTNRPANVSEDRARKLINALEGKGGGKKNKNNT